jgi:acyl-coenzyme A synthetase/AMP-(fatty) acid ligase
MSRTSRSKPSVPKQVRFLETLPKSGVGKILRKNLRALP